MKKEIDAWVWNPADALFKQKKSEKAIGHIIYCECPENASCTQKVIVSLLIIIALMEAEIELSGIQEWQVNFTHG